MKTFSGFPAGKVRSTRVPEPVFTELVPMIDDLDELKVTLHALYLLGRQEGRVRYVCHRDLLDDHLLLEGLSEPLGAVLEAALDRAVVRGTFLRAEAEIAGRQEVVYFANTSRGRAALEALRRGEPLQEVSPTSRPNVFIFYEENIGPLTPLIAEELEEAEELYPADWIEAAFREAVALNTRSWKYIRAILERWRSEGRKDEAERQDRKDPRRYVEGKYSEFVER
jgi:DNA replication protein